MIVNPKVSILVPIYGVEKFIERCAISLFEQTFDDIEYIFVNDCTPDKSIDILKEVLEKYPYRKSQVQIINHEVNKGVSAARNTGIENVNGSYILQVDGDDFLELNAIEILYNKAISDKADIVICDYYLEWDNERKKVIQNFDFEKTNFINMLISGEATPCFWNKLIKKELYINYAIKTKEGVNMGEDLMVIPKLIYFSNKMTKLNIPLYHYIQLNTLSYTKKMTKKNIENLNYVLNDLKVFFESKQDGSLYGKSLLKGKLRKKIELIYQSNVETFHDSYYIFPEINNMNNINFLSFRERILFYFIKLDNMIILKKYLKFYNNLFEIIQRLKGR